MGDYKEGDVLDTSTIQLNRFEIRGSKKKHIGAAESIKIVKMPDGGKPVAVVNEWGDGTGNKNGLLGGHL